MLRLGAKTTIKEQHLPKLDHSLSPHKSIARMMRLSAATARSDGEGMTLLKIIFRTESTRFLIYITLALTSSVLALMSPTLTKYII